MDCYTRQQIKEAVTKKGYKWFESGDYNINIVGDFMLPGNLLTATTISNEIFVTASKPVKDITYSGLNLTLKVYLNRKFY